MTDDIENEHDISPEDLLNEYHLAKEFLESMHNNAILYAQNIGFCLNAMDVTIDNFTLINENINKYPEIKPVISSAYYQIVEVNCNLNELDRDVSSNLDLATRITGSIFTTCSTSGSALASISPEIVNTIEAPSFLEADKNKVSSILYNLDPSLAKTYNEIEQVYYGTNADNTRSALNSMRQTFDHFFEILAPDDNVRQSKFWKPKNGENDPKMVTRRERINYAINTNIRNSYKARLMKKDVQLIIDSYNALNSLHKRGNVNIKIAKSALYTIKHFIEDFACVINEKKE